MPDDTLPLLDRAGRPAQAREGRSPPQPALKGPTTPNHARPNPTAPVQRRLSDPARSIGARMLRPAGQGSQVDTATLPLFTSPLIRTFRLRRNLRYEASLPNQAGIPWVAGRLNAAADDCAFNARLHQLHEQHRLLLEELRESETRRFKIRVNRGRHGEPFSLVRLGTCASYRRAPTHLELQEVRVFGVARKLSRLRDIESEIAKMNAAAQRLHQVLVATKDALAAAQRRRFAAAQSFAWTPQIDREIRQLTWPIDRQEVEGAFCPTPHLAFEGWRHAMRGYGEALKSLVIMLNRGYNLRRREHKPGFGKQRRGRFALITHSDTPAQFGLPRMCWRFAIWMDGKEGAGGFIYSYAEVRKWTYSRALGWQEHPRRVPVLTPTGRLNREAVFFASQPQMYSLLQAVDWLVAVWSELRARGTAAFADVVGGRANRHPHGGTPRADWDFVGQSKAEPQGKGIGANRGLSKSKTGLHSSPGTARKPAPQRGSDELEPNSRTYVA